MNFRYQTVLFDLDGTLTDPIEGITTAVAYALSQYGIQVEDRSILTPFIGPPLKDSFMEFYGFSEAQALEATAHYRVYFEDKGLYQNIPYPGIHKALAQLQTAGLTLMLATSKPEPFARRILEHFELLPYISFVGGAAMDETRTHKDEVIRYVLEENGLMDHRDRVVMVGDRKFDVQGAAAFGLDCIGVLFGYGSKEELETAGATYLVETVPELVNLLLQPCPAI